MKQGKSLRELTEVEFNKLHKTGLLKTIYPDAPDEYKEIRGTRPKPLAKPDFKRLIKYCEGYMQTKENPAHVLKDPEHYIFEIAIDCIYGDNSDSGVWDFINKN